MRDVLTQLYKTKLQLLALLSTVAGIALIVLSHSLAATRSIPWLTNLPLADVGSALFTTGLLAVAFEYLDRKDGDERANQRFAEELYVDIRDQAVRSVECWSDAQIKIPCVRIGLGTPRG